MTSMRSSKFSSFFSCLLQTYFLCSELVSGCLVAERSALLQFRNGLNDPETRLSSWQGRECCSWRGVKCDNQTGSITSIDLANPHPNINPDIVGSHGFWNLSGKIDSSLLQLKSLEHLDLRYNTFEGIPIPSFFGSLKKLRYLNLSNAGFSGTVPPQLGNLTSLQYLDLSSLYRQLKVDDFKWISGLSSLKVLWMNSVDISMAGSGLFLALNKLSSFNELHMSDCGIAGIDQNLPLVNLTSLRFVNLAFTNFNTVIPNWFANLSSLVHLDLFMAGFSGPIPEISRISSLRFIDLSCNYNLTADISKLLGGNWRQVENILLTSNRVHGFLPDSIGNLTSLIELDLSENNIQGGIPSSLGKVCNLESLTLDDNNLNLSLPRSLEVRGCLSDKPLQNLQYFYMRNNGIEGILPEWLGELRNLSILNLAYNKITGSIPTSFGNLSLLTDLMLYENQLNGTISSAIGNLSKLEYFDVSSNQLTGIVKEEHFLKSSGLKSIVMSSNSLIVKFSSSWIPPFQINNLFMASCQLGPQFPSWIRNQKEFKILDISNNSISGEIPNWFWDISSNLSSLDISFNKLEGHIPNHMKFAPFADVDLSNNLFSGSIPMPLTRVLTLDFSFNKFSGVIPSNFGQLQPYIFRLLLSYNNLSGTIPPSIGDLQSLQIIDLSNNHLISSIPSSFENCSSLEILILEYNNLSGQIPHSLGSLVQLQILHLNNNGLSGLIPPSLQNCTNLKTLDLGNNDFTGSIPAWLGERLTELRILRLRSNKFIGQIPSQLSNLKSLQVLDLAKNLLFGTIPHSFGALEAMNTPSKLQTYLNTTGNLDPSNSTGIIFSGGYYPESISMEINNIQLIYTFIIKTSIDLSGNNLSGEFPETLANLSGLINLDLSENNLTGKIPQNIYKMKELESLDLSKNNFFGEIPKTISSLMFLGNLNLSNNNFSGMIPDAGQMTTFNSSAFSGNNFLCGQPLVIVCKKDNVNMNNTSDQNNGDDMNQELVDDWFYLAFGFGFAVGLLGLVAVIFIKKPWAAYYDFVNFLVKKVMNVKRTVPRKLNSLR